MSYHIKVRLGQVSVRDRESDGPYDSFYVTGMLLVDGVPHAFEAGPTAANETIRVVFPTDGIFEGPAKSRDIGLILRGYDIDDNDQWIKRRRSIVGVNQRIADWLKKVPSGGDVLGSILEAWPDVVDKFVELDSDDLLINHRTMVHLPEVSGSYGAPASHFRIDIRGTGDTILSDWDYTVPVLFEYRNNERGTFPKTEPTALAPKRNSAVADWIGEWRSVPKSIETKDTPFVRCLISRSAFNQDLMDVAIVENVKATKERRTFGVEITRAWHLLIESEDIEEGKKPLIIGRTIRESISSGATIIRVLNDGEVWERMEVTDQGHFDSVLPDPVGRHLAGFPQTSKSELADPDLLELNDDAILEILVDELGSSNVLRYRRPTGPHAMKVAAPIDYLLFRAG